MARPPLLSAIALLAAYLFIPFTARASEVMCDPAYQDCHATLLKLVRAETNRIDIAMWFMEDDELANAIIERFRSGVAVRAIVDPRRNPTTPKNAVILSMFQNARIPMRYKTSGGILHWKFIILNAQNTMEWSAANYADYYFKPVVPYLNYTDEGIYFSDDPAVVNSFRRKFDDSWIDTAGFANYANISGTPIRTYPLYPIDPALNFVPAENFGVRSKPLYDAETQRIDSIMYKITESTHADGIIRAVRRGIPVRLILEPERYRNKENVWHAYHVDRLYAAGVQIRDRAHEGFLHQKSTLLYSQRLTVFGSSNWSNESNRSQYEHNYFTTKPWFFTWFKDNFERKWGNLTGNLETKPFVPLPPDVPVYVAPADGATGISTTTTTTIRWKPGPWAHRADIYFGTSSTPPLLASNVSVSANSTKTYTLPALSPRTTYYWRIVSRTMAAQTASGPTYAFTTQGGTPPPPPPVCSFVVTPTSASFGFEAGEKSVSVSTTAGCSWTARSNATFLAVIGGASGAGSGTVRYQATANSGPSRTGSLTIAGQTVTITQEGTITQGARSRSKVDFDGDGKSDVAVFRPSNGTWYIRYSGTGEATGFQWGNSSDVPVPGDYDGDGRADIAVFRPSNGTWYVRDSATGATSDLQWGNSLDVPVPGDYDGDGMTDVAVFRPANGVWYLRYSRSGTTTGVQWGNSTDVLVPGDYDGDGATDVAVFRPSNGVWYLRYSSTGTTTGVQWGNGNDVTVPGDYDGDGRTDIAVFRPSNGIWYLRYSSAGTTAGLQWGNASDKPVPGDYDGDGRTDVAVFRPSNGVWYLWYSSTGTAAGVQWGGGSDVPIVNR